jgi:hypothetical protein
MDWSQWLIVGLLVLSCYTGKPKPIVWVAMWGDLVATILLHRDPGEVATADLVAFALLLGSANIVAAIFIAMQPIYIAGHYFGLNEGSIYTIIDIMAFVQFAAIGGWDAGLGKLRRSISRRIGGTSVSLVYRREAANDLGHAVSLFSRDSGGR